MGYFAEQYKNLHLPYGSEGVGLRNAQRGAIYAIGSHNTLYPDEAAIVVMPTGAGKTSVLMIQPFLTLDAMCSTLRWIVHCVRFLITVAA